MPRRSGGRVFRLLAFSGTLQLCPAFRSSAGGFSQPSSNYAFKRTAGTLHCVSCCSFGPRPLNAPLDEGGHPAASCFARFSRARRLHLVLGFFPLCIPVRVARVWARRAGPFQRVASSRSRSALIPVC
jgi:hypothetical protein